MSSESTTNGLWLTSESIRALLASSERTSLVSELVHADRWESGGRVVLSLILVNFVNWDGSVDDGWLDGLLLDDWLDGLVDVVVNVLTSNSSTLGSGVLSFSYSAGVLELSLLSGETLLDVGIISVLNVAVLDGSEFVGVLFWENLTIVDRLDRSVVMILMHLTIHSGCCVLVVGLGYVLVLDGWVDGLMDSGVMLSILGEEIADSCLGTFHCDLLGCICKCWGGCWEIV